MASSIARSLTWSAAPLALAGVVACFGNGTSDVGGPGPGGPGADGGAADGGGGGDGSAHDDGGGPGPLPFAPDSPSVYVAKVKNVLVGLPPTDDEVKAVTADPSQLGALVDGWMKLPAYTTKMRRFFELAFQQTQVTEPDFNDQLSAAQLQLDRNTATQPLMLQNLQESFARTMLDPSAQGQPFTQATTTQTFAMTTALKVLYGLLDVWQVDDKGNFKDLYKAANPGVTLYVQSAPITPAGSSFDPTSPNFLHFSSADAANCATDPVSYPAQANTLYYILQGFLPGCPKTGTKAQSAQLTPSDFADWTMTTVRAPNGGEATTAFYDLPKLRAAKELVLDLPRVGFFTTPAFFANWPTNDSNQMRVTMNQTLIVATGAQVDGTDTTVATKTPGLDTTHAGSPECFSCHQLLDPTRSIMAATYSWNYHTQTDATYSGQKGVFAFQGVQTDVGSVLDLGKVLGSHPLFAQAWAEKLCYYVDSEACVPADPEFQAIVQAFQSSGYSWSALVKAIVTSPITTHTKSTLTATTNGETVAVSRRDHLCASWNARLGFADICGLDATQPNVAPGSAIEIVTGFPSDGYGRGSVAPVLPNQPTLFYRAGVENVCESIAALVIDNKSPPANAKTWQSTQPDPAIADFVSLVMGLPPSDPRAATAASVLHAHFDAAKQEAGMSVSSALQSTFVLACMAPSAISMGM